MQLDGHGKLAALCRKYHVRRLGVFGSAARWVSKQTWHGKQRGAFDAEGRYVLELPYSDDRELLMDILRHGADVEVLEPPELRQRVAGAQAQAARLYGQARPDVSQKWSFRDTSS